MRHAIGMLKKLTSEDVSIIQVERSLLPAVLPRMGNESTCTMAGQQKGPESLPVGGI